MAAFGQKATFTGFREYLRSNNSFRGNKKQKGGPKAACMVKLF
jgi:hypothetical protein